MAARYPEIPLTKAHKRVVQARPFPCPSSVASRVACATLVAGTLDLLAAVVIAGMFGHDPASVLQGIASAVIGDYAYDVGSIVPFLIGLVLHFLIMLAMAGTYVLASRRLRFLNDHPVLCGVCYGLALWLVMYGVVLPLRWNGLFPMVDPGRVAGQIFCHVVLVGLPISFTAARHC